MNGFLAAFAIIFIVVWARLAYRAGFNFFTFTLGAGVLAFAVMILTGSVP